MKNQAQFTPHQLETWTAVLSVFPVKVVNRAVLQIGLSVDPFPDLGKVVVACQHAMPRRKNDYGNEEYAPSHDSSKISNVTIAGVAAALGVEI